MEGPRYSSSAFSPAAARKTSVCLLRNRDTGDHRLVTSISTRKSTEVLRINLRSGRLELENDATAESSYANESEALAQLHSRGFELAERGSALLGYVMAGPAAGVLLATRSKEKAVLPGGHTVYAVTDSQWIIVPLLNESADAAQAAVLAGLPPPKGDVDFWRTLQQFTLNNAHYYCETADISRPFPSDKDPREPSPEFVWNSWLRQPLVELGLYDHCPALLQGAVECATLQHPSGGARFSMCLTSRRSRRHPGTRYIARGLNTLAGPGNEIECELLTWTHPQQQYGAGSSSSSSSSSAPRAAGSATAAAGGSEALRWARVVWRRGTVPIWWGVQLQSLAQGLQAEVYVREEHPYQGTASYFRNVQRQHAPRPTLAQPPATAPASNGGGGVDADGSGASLAADGSREGWTLVDEGFPGGSSSSAAAAAAAAAGRQQQQGLANADPAAAVEAAGACVPVTCINLLHANPKKASELMLSSHFQDAMRHVRRRLGGQAPIKVVNFDWHGNMGRLTEEKAVEGFWSLMEPFVKQTGFAAGWMEAAPDAAPATPTAAAAAAAKPAKPAKPDASGAASASAASSGAAGEASRTADAAEAEAAPATAWPPGWSMRWSRQQAGLLRFNCADSLDRTNAATCFAMLPVLQEQLRVLGLALECAVPPATAALQRSRGRSSNDVVGLAGQQQQGQQQGPALEDVAAALPEGWEVRQHEGRLLFIDHVNQKTQWTPPLVGGASSAPSSATSSAAPSATVSRSVSGSRPSSAAPLSSRMMQSATDMLARLQQRQGGGSGSPTPLMGLERHSSPPRTGGPDGGSQYWARSSSSSSLSGGGGGVPHAASSPDVSSQVSRTSTAAGAAAVPDKDPYRPWAFFEYDIADVRERLLKDAVDGYVDMFRVHGDIHSFLYTGSPAMHSHVLNLVTQGGKAYGATSGVGKLQNLRVAVQRRWNNTVSDSSRQQAMELFLGLRIHDQPGGQRGYFPGLQVMYHDTTQAQLSGIEPFEQLPLTSATHPHSHPAPPPLTSSTAVREPAGAAAAAVQSGGWRDVKQAAAEGEQEEGQAAEEGEEEEEDRAHAVPGVPAVHHDGMLGVPQSLLDLEPMPDPAPQQHQQQLQSSQSSEQGSGGDPWAAADREWEAGSPAGSGGGGGDKVQQPQPQPQPWEDFGDPLSSGFVSDTRTPAGWVPGSSQGGGLIDLEGSEVGAGAAGGARSPSPASTLYAPLKDLLL